MDERYPIGEFDVPSQITRETVESWLTEIEALPKKLRDAVVDLNAEQLDTPYRHDGWTVRQVIHHLADSHMNAYIRCKLALTEEEPTVKTYEEGKWAELPDSMLPITSSLLLLESLHVRWVTFLQNLSIEDYNRTFRHPDNGLINLKTCIGLYAWHGNHHLAHITSLTSRLGWK